MLTEVFNIQTKSGSFIPCVDLVSREGSHVVDLIYFGMKVALVLVYMTGLSGVERFENSTCLYFIQATITCNTGILMTILEVLFITRLTFRSLHHTLIIKDQLSQDLQNILILHKHVQNADLIF